MMNKGETQGTQFRRRPEIEKRQRMGRGDAEERQGKDIRETKESQRRDN